MQAGDLCRFVQVLCKDTKELVQNAGYQFFYEVPSIPFITLYDGDLLLCAICNLISNACKFTNPESSHITLKMTVWEKQVTITITDNGSGIKPQVLKRAFERFYSFDPQTGAPCGDGWAFLSVAFFCSCIMERLPFKRKKGKGQLLR